MSNCNGNRGKRPGDSRDPATKSVPRPGDFALGSVQSRAAARAMADAKNDEDTVIQIIAVSPDGTKRNGPVLRLHDFE